MSRKNIILLSVTLSILVIAIVATLLIVLIGNNRPKIDPVLHKNIVELYYHEDYKILQLADVHVDSAENCGVAFKELDRLVQHVKPDLIVLTGDNIFETNDKAVFDLLVDNMEKYKTAWAPVFGNHDSESGISKEYMANGFENAKYCVFKSGPDDIEGVGNYVINLKNGKRNIKRSLFMIDSNMYLEGDPKLGYDYIHDNQVEWYKTMVNYNTKLNRGKVVPSLAFFHIPVEEHADALDKYKQDNSIGYGEYREPEPYVYSSKHPSNFFETAKELGSTQAFIVGHDHINNGLIHYEGIDFVYGLKSSRLCYYNEDMIGGMVITIGKDNNVAYNNVYFRDILQDNQQP